MTTNGVPLQRLGGTSERNSINSDHIFAKGLEKFHPVESLRLMKMGILTYTAFSYLRKKSSKFSEMGKDNLESKKKTSLLKADIVLLTSKPCTR